MSHIPNAAIPHAGGPELAERDAPRGLRDRISDGAGRLSETARAHPRVTVAAGAAVLAGAVAAAAIPMMRGRGDGGSKKGRSKKS